VFGTSIGKRLLAVAGLLPLMVQMTGLPGGGPDPINTVLRFEELVVYKYEGNQPYDVVARLVDGNGDPATGAQVKVIFAALAKWPIELKEMKSGVYIGCDLETVDIPSGELLLRVAAEKKGYSSILESTTDQRGNACGEGEPQIYISKVQASKLNGAKQPLDVFVYLEDETGAPVTEATVMARATDFDQHVDAALTHMGGGKYLACALGNFSTRGGGQISIHLHATAKGYREAASDTVNTVGTICGKAGPPPVTEGGDDGTAPANDDTNVPGHSANDDRTSPTSRGDGRYAK
jgi:hypothetical protein